MEAMPVQAARLVEGLRRGDERALEELASEYGGMIGAWASMEGADSQDLVQDVLLRVWTAGTRLQPETHLPSWLKTVTLNAARNRRRDRSRRPAVPVGLELEQASGADPIAVKTEELFVEGALGALSQHQRDVLELMYLQDRPVAEVAKQLHVSPEAAKSLAARARRRLRLEIEASGT